MSEILKQAKKFRTELLSLDDDALKLLERTYTRSMQRLQDQLESVVNLIETAKASGEFISPAWIARQDRYADLMTQIDDEMNRFAGYASSEIKSQQSRALALGLDHSNGLMDAALPKSIGVTFNRVNFTAVENMVGFLRDGSPLDYKFAGMADGLKMQVKDILTEGITQGINPRKMAKTINEAAGGQMTNVLTTCRTETLRAYRSAADATYDENADILDGWVWCAAQGARTCAGCWGMDGSFHKTGESLSDHANGRCTKLPVTKPWSEIVPGYTGKETRITGWDSHTAFDNMPEKSQLAVLGKTKFDLYKAGDIRLTDIPHLTKSKIWGDSYGVGNIESVRNNAMSRRR